jgi:transcriptional regulator of acetoin/glycerol metabolism
MQAAGQVAIAMDNAFAYGQIAELKDELAQEKLYLEDEIRSELNFDETVGDSGAVRELENFIERAVILTRGSALNVPVSELSEGPPGVNGTVESASSEREQIVRVLRDTDGRVGGPKGAAVRLGLKRTTLISRMKKLGINPVEVS